MPMVAAAAIISLICLTHHTSETSPAVAPRDLGADFSTLCGNRYTSIALPCLTIYPHINLSRWTSCKRHVWHYSSQRERLFGAPGLEEGQGQSSVATEDKLLDARCTPDAGGGVGGGKDGRYNPIAGPFLVSRA